MTVSRADDDGTAIVEFVFVAIVIMIPLVYLIAAVAAVQRSQLAVSQAARDAGRAFATSDTSAQAQLRVQAAVRLAMSDQNLPDDAVVRFVPADADCSAAAITPQLRAGAVFAVCVTRHAEPPRRRCGRPERCSRARSRTGCSSSRDRTSTG